MKTLHVKRTLFGMLVLGSSLGLGAIPTAVLAPIIVVAVVLFGFVMIPALHAEAIDSARWQPTAKTKLLLGLATALTIFTWLQTLPLPAGIVHAISPQAADIWTRSVSPFRETSPFWLSFSLDPTATYVECARGLLYLMVFICAAHVAREKREQRFLANLLIGSACVMALAALLHPALGAQRVLGLYQPYAHFTSRHTAPLLNANHLGAYLNVGFCVALAQALKVETAGAARDATATRAGPSVRTFSIAAVLFLAGTQVFVASRGAVGGMVLGGILILALVGLGQARKQARPFGYRVGVASGIVVVVGAGLFGFSMSDEARTELGTSELSKLDLIANAAKLLRLFPLVGVGRGAFESTFPAVDAQTNGTMVFTHPENILLQWGTEWGLPVALVALVIIVYALRPHAALRENTTEAAAFTALAVTFAHNMVDFNSEAPGMMVVLCICAGIVCTREGVGRRRRSGTRRSSDDSGPRAKATRAAVPRRVGAYIIFSILAVSAVGSALFIFVSRNHELFAEQIALRDALTDAKSEFQARLREAVRRHPAAPYPTFLGALKAEQDAQSVIPWVARTLERCPRHARAHSLLARALTVRNPSQARLEYRLSYELDGTLFAASTNSILALTGDYDSAFQLVPRTQQSRAYVMDALSRQIETRLPSTAYALDDAIILEGSTDSMVLNASAATSKSGTGNVGVSASVVDALDRHVARWLTDARTLASWCGADHCANEALIAAQRLKLAAQNACRSYVRVAECKQILGDKEALTELEAATETVADRAFCLKETARLASAANDKARLARVLERITGSSCSPQSECMENLLYAAGIEQGRGNPRSALVYIGQAADMDSRRVDLWKSRAEIAGSVGLNVEAAEAYGRLAEIDAEHAAAWKAAQTKAQSTLQKSVPGAGVAPK